MYAKDKVGWYTQEYESGIHTSVQALFLGTVNCVDAEQMWWYIRDGILKKTGIGIILDMRLEITLPRNAAAHPIYVELS